MKKRSDIAICFNISKGISVFNAMQVGHTVIKMLKLQICNGDANSTAVENKVSKDNAILQRKVQNGVLDDDTYVDLMRCRLVIPKNYCNRYQ